MVFSLQLILPDKAVSALEQFSHPVQSATPDRDRPAATALACAKFESQRLIEELDSAQFGGPSFGEQTIAVMTKALDDALAELPAPVETNVARELARKILARAADGERNLARLRQAALGDLVAPEPEPGG